jgi:hypothetical protein
MPKYEYRREGDKVILYDVSIKPPKPLHVIEGKVIEKAKTAKRLGTRNVAHGISLKRKGLLSTDPETLELLGLPPYWHEETLKQLYARLGTFEKVAQHLNTERAKKTGVKSKYYSRVVIARVATDVFGWDIRGEMDGVRRAVIHDYYSVIYEKTRPSYVELAKKYGVSRVTVKAWLEAALEGQFSSKPMD